MACSFQGAVGAEDAEPRSAEPTKVVTLAAASLALNVLPATWMASWGAKSSLPDVTQGVTEAVLKPSKDTDRSTAEWFSLMAMMAKLPLVESLYADRNTLGLGAAVAPMRT